MTPHTPKPKSGDIILHWRLISLAQDGPRSDDRSWLVACRCGKQQKKREPEIRQKRGRCIACGMKGADA